MTVLPLAIHTEIFKAAWPKSLDPSLESTLSKTKKFTWNFFSILIFPIGLIRLTGYFIRNLAFSFAVPGNTERDSVEFNARVARICFKKFSGTPLQLATPDGGLIEGAFFEGKNPQKVVVYGGGNRQQWENLIGEVIHLQSLGCSVLVLNSRGTGKSKGERNQAGYALDYYTAYEYLIHKKNVDPENILAVGFSMGGAHTTRAAGLIQEKYPDKKISAINMCSFSSLRSEIQSLFSDSGIFSLIGKYIAPLVGIDMKVKSAWDKLKGEKVIFYNPKDEVIPRNASLYKAVKQHPIGTTKAIKMRAEKSSENHCMKQGDNSTLSEEVTRILQLKSSFWKSLFHSPPSPALETRFLQQVG